jgi:hypothetical protein
MVIHGDFGMIGFDYTISFENVSIVLAIIGGAKWIVSGMSVSFYASN